MPKSLKKSSLERRNDKMTNKVQGQQGADDQYEAFTDQDQSLHIKPRESDISIRVFSFDYSK